MKEKRRSEEADFVLRKTERRIFVYKNGFLCRPVREKVSCFWRKVSRRPNHNSYDIYGSYDMRMSFLIVIYKYIMDQMLGQSLGRLCQRQLV